MEFEIQLIKSYIKNYKSKSGNKLNLKDSFKSFAPYTNITKIENKTVHRNVMYNKTIAVV
jgi:hypothetical protein